MSTIKYRKDIDGLRAVAVISVIVCHANAAWLPGGFVGVDVFFVISGYLITSIILREMHQGKFTFKDFYLRRIKRILPVFFVVVFTVLVAGFIILLPDDFVFLSKSARYASFFMSNIHFAGELDYFAPAMNEAPLIHTWSLGVEEQYYFVWPVMLLLMLRYARPYLLMVSLVLCVASFLLATVWAMDESRAVWSFYQLPARMGELMVGSLLVFGRPLLEKQNVTIANIAAIVGMVLLAASFFLLNENSVFPGYNALWPCTGAALLIMAGYGQQGLSPVTGMLSMKPMVFVGKISYSLYLWHWPVLVYVRYYTMQESLSFSWIFASLAVTFALSWLSWHFIEQPVRRSNTGFKKATIRYFLCPAFLVLIVGAVAKHMDGYILGNDNPELNHVVVKDIGCVYKIRESCRIGSTQGSPKVIMFGDSHAKHYSLVFDQLGKKQGVPIDFLTANSCPFMLSHEYNNGKRCSNLTAYAVQNMHEYQKVVIALRWSQYLQTDPDRADKTGQAFIQQLRKQLQQWTGQGKQVFLVAQAPEYEKDIQRLWRFGRSENLPLERYVGANRQLQVLDGELPGVFLASFDAVLQGWENGRLNKLPAYIDSHHLNAYGQKALAGAVLAKPDKFKWLQVLSNPK